MEKEERLNYDQIMALFDKMALDAKRREEEEKKRREEREAEEKKRREEREAEEKKRREEREAEEKKREAEAIRRDEEAAKKRAKETREYNERIKKLEKLVGGIGKNNGHYAEEFFQNAFSKTLTFAGIKFDIMISNLKVEKKESCEFDIVLANGDTIAIIEAKNRVYPSFVEELVTQKLTRFRKFFPVYANYRIYLGVAGLSFDDSVIEEANKFGVGIVRQDGKSIEVNTEGIKVY